MDPAKPVKLTRRRFVDLAAKTAIASPFIISPMRAVAGKAPLRIARWKHLLPEYDIWFSEYARNWGREHDTPVAVDYIAASEIDARANAEITAGQGHDLFAFPVPPAMYQRHAVDHRDVYAAVSRKHGTVVELGHKSTFDPRIKKYFAFTDFFIPAPLLYLHDCWGSVNLPLGPAGYAELLAGGEKIRSKLGVPSGLNFAPGLDGNVTLLGMLWSFGASVIDEDGNVTLNSPRTLGALRIAKQIYDRAGSAEMLIPSSFATIVSRKSSCTVNAISLLRMGEQRDHDGAKQIMVSPPPHGLASKRLAAPRAINCSVIWKFARNQELAQQFLVDLVDASATSFEKSRYCNFPCFPSMVPDLIKRLANDPAADPAFKYKELEDALHWTQNLGYPGYATPEIMQVIQSSLLPGMFARVLRSEATPEAAAAAAESEVRGILRKWGTKPDQPSARLHDSHMPS